MRDDGGSETSHQTGAQVDDCLHTVGCGALVHALVDSLGNLLVDDKLGHCVWDLLEQDRTEAAVECTKTLLRGDLAEARDEAAGEGRFGDETDTGGFERAKGNIGEEFGASGGCEVDGSSVVAGGLVAEQVDRLLLEELITAELECTLQEVAGEGWANTGQESAGALLCDDLTEAADQAAVVCNGIKLDSCLDAVALLDFGT